MLAPILYISKYRKMEEITQKPSTPIDTLLTTIEEQKSTMTDQKYKESMEALACLQNEHEQELYVIKVYYGYVNLSQNKESYIRGEIISRECEFLIRAKVSDQFEHVRAIDSVLQIPARKPLPLHTTISDLSECSVTTPLFNCERAFRNYTAIGVEMTITPYNLLIIDYRKISEKKEWSLFT